MKQGKTYYKSTIKRRIIKRRIIKRKSLNERQERKVSISKKKDNYSVQVEAFTAKTVRK